MPKNALLGPASCAESIRASANNNAALDEWEREALRATRRRGVLAGRTEHITRRVGAPQESWCAASTTFCLLATTISAGEGRRRSIAHHRAVLG